MTDSIETASLGPTGAKINGPVKQNAGLLVATCFTASMLLSALLLFFVQPMFAKMALPLLGGSSGVWNTAMVFFQAVLLGGYLYAHLLSKYFPFRIQILLHGLVIASATFILPIAIPHGWEVPQSGTPTLWLLGLFAVALGAPFFALSANAPLLQKWFSYTSHKSSGDPYFLYAASNAGSLLSLLSYPLLVEPFFKLSGQSYVWAVGFVMLMAMIIGCGFLAEQFASVKNLTQAASVNAGKPLDGKRKLAWIGYAILPSSLMLGVTTHLTSNVASAPFLWVLPLALYLFTFIVAFSPRPPIPFRLVEKIFPFAVVAALIFSSNLIGNLVLDIVGNLTCFYLIAQMCHNRLAADRPASEHLTLFYFFMSLGGVIGGALTALVAPVVFDDVYEYQLMIVFSGLVAIGAFPHRHQIKREVLITAGIVTMVLGLVFWAHQMPELFRMQTDFGPVSVLATGTVFSILITGIILNRTQPLRIFVFLSSVALLVINMDTLVTNKQQHVVYKGRSFFGISKVSYEVTTGGPAHIFAHGNTVHNIQMRKNGHAVDFPVAYYSPGGAFGQAVEASRTQTENPSVAVIGLGAGAMACHVRENEYWKFYELDPMIVDLARNQSLFTYVNNCAPDAPVVTGDARLTLQQEPNESFDLIMIDAFSSNVIPAHLVTLEALALYQSKLKPGGAIFFHTSNRYLDVNSVVLNAAEASGLATRTVYTKPAEDQLYKDQITPSRAVLAARSDAELDAMLKHHPEWKTSKGDASVGVWRDDFSHVLGALLAKL